MNIDEVNIAPHRETEIDSRKRTDVIYREGTERVQLRKKSQTCEFLQRVILVFGN